MRSEEGLFVKKRALSFGHYAFALPLLPILASTPGSRIVVVSSEMHRQVSRINFDDLLKAERKYNEVTAYSESKLANILFVRGLVERLAAAGKTSPLVCSSHPGYTATDLQRDSIFKHNNFIANSVDKGTLPQMFAAVEPSVKSNDYVGFDGFMHSFGNPQVHAPTAAALNDKASLQLWEMSEKVTGIKWDDVWSSTGSSSTSTSTTADAALSEKPKKKKKKSVRKEDTDGKDDDKAAAAATTGTDDNDDDDGEE